MLGTLNRLILSINRSGIRGIHSIQLKELKLKEYGSSSGVELVNSELVVDKLKGDEVLVKLIAAPINPADINIIQGKYGILPPSLPATIGNEGVFEVLDKGENCEGLKQGDWVIPAVSGWGTWRSHSIETYSHFIRIPNNLNKHACATLTVNPVTAFRMLHDFVNIKPGDTVIQNGANSGVGQAVIQIGKAMKVNVVNIVRKREGQEELTNYLKSLGAEFIFTEDELRKPILGTELWKQIPRPRLGLNCVGGKATSDLVRLLDSDSTLVTYGGMSRQPVILNTADFIFKDLKCKGFWLTRMRKNNPEEFERTIHELCEMIKTGKLLAPRAEEFSLEQFRSALDASQKPFRISKIIFTP